jgi:hypothetical protein
MSLNECKKCGGGVTAYTAPEARCRCGDKADKKAKPLKMTLAEALNHARLMWRIEDEKAESPEGTYTAFLRQEQARKNADTLLMLIGAAMTLEGFGRVLFEHVGRTATKEALMGFTYGMSSKKVEEMLRKKERRKR